MGKYFNDQIDENVRTEIQILKFSKYIGIYINNQKYAEKATTDEAPIQFNQNLDLNKYAHKKLKENAENFKYKLKAMIYFKKPNHYFSWVKPQEKWYKINDSKVSYIKSTKKEYEEQKNLLPAILYYERASSEETT